MKFCKEKFSRTADFLRGFHEGWLDFPCDWNSETSYFIEGFMAAREEYRILSEKDFDYGKDYLSIS